MAGAARIRSWMAPDAVGGPWYGIESIRPETHTGVLLELALADVQVFGCLATRTEERPLVHSGGRYGVRTREAIRRVEWQEWRATSRALAPLCPYRMAVPGIRWTWREPRAFRPLDADQVDLVLSGARSPVRAWPAGAVLPAPLDGRIRQAPRPSSADEEPDVHPPSPDATRRDPVRSRAADGWPYPDVALGDRIPPATPEEAEARLLRAWRTAEAADRVAPAGSSTCSDIPREMVMVWRRFADADRRVEAWQKGLPDDPSLDALPARWKPERRDQNDCAYALDWLRHLAHPQARAILALRAALPPFSWRQVGERVRLTGAGALKAHRSGMELIVTAEGGA